MSGTAELADSIRKFAKKYQSPENWFIGTMREDKSIKVAGVVVDDDEYWYLSSIDFDEINDGDKVLVFKPDDEKIVLIGKLEEQ